MFTHFIEIWGESNKKPIQTQCQCIEYLQEYLLATSKLFINHTIAVFKIKLKKP